MILGVVFGRSIWIDAGLGENRARIGSVAESARAGKNIGKSVASGFDLEPLFLSRCDRNIKIARIGGHALHRPSFTPELAADYAHFCAVIVGNLGNGARRN